MITNRPRRLDGVSYVGMQRYFLTICAAFRRPLFDDATLAAATQSHILHVATTFAFAVGAYCIMPDHVHLLMLAQSDQSDLERFVKQLKQVTGFAYKQGHRKPLWQPGYHDRILRDDVATLDVARYILENPVRAGLAKRLGEWPFAGSGVYSWDQLRDLWELDGTSTADLKVCTTGDSTSTQQTTGDGTSTQQT
jgi:REP element-mobilizing transposase RayT